MKSYKNAVRKRVSFVWQWLIGTFLIAFFITGCSLGPPTPEEFHLPTPSFTPTIDPRDYTPTPLIYPTSSDSSPVPKHDCTFPTEYWKDHPQNWQFAVITVGGQTYNKQQALVFFNTQPENTYIFIYEQIFTIENNILSGADPQVINQILVQMNRWLDEHPNGSSILDAEQNTGIYLARQIELYNLGFIGPGLCAGEQAMATADFTYIPVEDTSTTPTLTTTPSQQAPTSGNQLPPAQPPTNTPKPTRKPGGGGGGPAPTQPPPSATHAPPTATKAPPPTRTKAPTKLPTPTSPPLATPVPTSPPKPTQGGGPPTPTTVP